MVNRQSPAIGRLRDHSPSSYHSLAYNGGQALQIAVKLVRVEKDEERDRMDIKIRAEDCFHLNSLRLFSALNRSREKKG